MIPIKRNVSILSKQYYDIRNMLQEPEIYT